MIVSYKWLKEYVNLDMPLDELTDRLTMSGLNLEGVEEIDGDTAIDLEVTSNRPDCLGHIGVAREIGVLFETDITLPEAKPATASDKTSPKKTESVTSVDIECEELCPAYIARVIRGIKVGPSPAWLVDRLKTLGIATVNNVVDITNYVLMECSQPLHAFDFDKLHEGRIVVRKARKGETLTAINQHDYPLDTEMCVIADADRPVAIGGVMGGLDTEIGEKTVNVLIETADFAPISIRNTARRLSLFSDSSFRFERGVDRTMLDWASRRCCKLILDIAGGELLDEPVIAGSIPREPHPPITLRFDQIPRLLGIDVGASAATGILTSLGLKQQDSRSNGSADFIPPTWRRDLTREVDLIEEVARIYGYEKIPDNVPVPLKPSGHSRHDRVAESVRELLTGAGCYEAVTLSFVSEKLHQLFTPYPQRPPVSVDHSSRRHENLLRQSLIPSLLVCRRENERHGTFNARLFEIAKVYLKVSPDEPEQEVEPTMIGLVDGRSYSEMKGLVEALAHDLNHKSKVTVRPAEIPQFAEGRGAEVFLGGAHWGWLGELDRAVSDTLDLKDAVTAAELRMDVLEQGADLTPRYTLLPQFPSVNRDLNFVLDEGTSWHELEQVIRAVGGPLLESIAFGGQYRGKQIEGDKKSYVAAIGYRSPERTLTNDEVEQAQQKIVAACRDQLGAELR